MYAGRAEMFQVVNITVDRSTRLMALNLTDSQTRGFWSMLLGCRRVYCSGQDCEVSTALILRILVLWVVRLSNTVIDSQHFKWVYCLHSQGFRSPRRMVCLTLEDEYDTLLQNIMNQEACTSMWQVRECMYIDIVAHSCNHCCHGNRAVHSICVLLTCL